MSNMNKVPENANYYSKKYGYLQRAWRNWFLYRGGEFIQFYMPVQDAVKIQRG